jgi:ADP-ribose pyrophosphatase YjhB (NUDIX family)
VRIRVTGVVIEEGRLLLQDGGTSWSLPGGDVGEDETLSEALVRRLHDQSGADVSVGRLLYICDPVPEEPASPTSIFFVANLIGGDVGEPVVDAETRPLRGVRFVEIADLAEYGFTATFIDLAAAGFPGSGSYLGATANIGL